MSSSMHRRLVLAALGLAFALPTSALAQEEKKEEEKKEEEKQEDPKKVYKEEVKKRWNKLKEKMKQCDRTTPDQQWQQIGEIGKIPHKKAVAYLKGKLFYVNPVPAIQGQVRAAAADALKGQREKMDPSIAVDATKWLMKATDDRWNRKEPEGDAVIRNAIKAIGELRSPTAKKFLEKLFTNSNTYWAEEAIRASEHLRDAGLIDKIIREWLRADNEGRKTQANDQDKERRNVIGDAAGSVLAALTEQNFEKPLDWQKWW
ncbi:MAG: HEAT repeat domain-containing protein, partial [Planctomycetota bacterium]